MPNAIEANHIYLTDDMDFIKSRLTEIFSMLKKGYGDKDGLIVKDEDDLFNKIQLIKLVFDGTNKIIACMIYRHFAGGNKMFLGAARRNDVGKAAFESIVQSDIEPYDNWFWGEVSGPVEHYFKKHNGRPIPKELAGKFLHNGSKIVPSQDPNDPVHYTRKIADLAQPVEKAIYGFKDEEMAKEVMESIDNYEEFRISVNSMPDKMHESTDLPYSKEHLEDALSIVIQVVDMHEEFGFNEMLPHWHTALTHAIKYMEHNINSISNAAKLKQVKSSIKFGKMMLDEMPILSMHQFHA